MQNPSPAPRKSQHSWLCLQSPFWKQGFTSSRSGHWALSRQAPRPSPRGSQQVLPAPHSPGSEHTRPGIPGNPPPSPPPFGSEQKKLGPQVFPCGQVPQSPPHPSGPQCLPAQLGTHAFTHFPCGLHTSPPTQVPQTSLHPSNPHCLFTHFGVQDPSETQTLCGPQTLP